MKGNYISQLNSGGHTIEQYLDHIIYDGERIDLPLEVQNNDHKNSLVVRDDLLVINGYKFNPITKSFKKLSLLDKWML